MSDNVEKMIAKHDFQIWMRAMGFHGKQVTEAARMIGVEGSRTATSINTGDRPLTETERLAMAAVRAGLPAWTPENDQEIADMASLRAIIERASARPSSARPSDEDANAA